MERKQIIADRIVATVAEYTKAFQSPCPMKIISAKFSRSLMELGGLPELIEDLAKAGTIQLWLARTGAKAVTIPGSKIQMREGVKV